MSSARAFHPLPVMRSNERRANTRTAAMRTATQTRKPAAMALLGASIVAALSALLAVASTAGAAPSDEELASFRKQLEEQRRLTLQLMRVEQQHYEFLMEL